MSTITAAAAPRGLRRPWHGSCRMARYGAADVVLVITVLATITLYYEPCPGRGGAENIAQYHFSFMISSGSRRSARCRGVALLAAGLADRWGRAT